LIKDATCFATVAVADKAIRFSGLNGVQVVRLMAFPARPGQSATMYASRTHLDTTKEGRKW